ncbi:MAG: DUF642 domain-containing protein [Planctomycetes bacterium]|nr:DUF642 domain-containing protein [Planctomycetota bacterium]
MRTTFIGALAVAALAPHAPAGVLNGSFESLALAAPDRVGIGSASAWTASGGLMLLERGPNGVSNISAQDGSQFVSMGHNGASNDTLFQDFATAAGETLDLSFFVACIQGDAVQRITASIVDVGSNSVLGNVDADVSSRTQGWLGFSLTFTTTGANTRVRFVHSVAADVANVALDNVTITPTPSAAALFAVAGFVTARRRR